MVPTRIEQDFDFSFAYFSPGKRFFYIYIWRVDAWRLPENGKKLGFIREDSHTLNKRTASSRVDE
jgi:hypothetical protein